MTIEDLKANKLILFEAVSGSRAFGLATENSDTDIRGVYYLPKDSFLGLDYIPQISNETNDITYYEIGRFMELLQKNNPNILEILASPDDCILYKHPLMDLLSPKDFLSRQCKDTFAGYAISQIKKAKGLNKKILNPVAKERKSVLDFCYILQDHLSVPLKKWLTEQKKTQDKCGLVNIDNTRGMFALFYDETGTMGYKGVIQNEEANQVSVSSIPKEAKCIAYLFCNLDAYSVYCKDYREYWKWVSERNEDRYNVNQKNGLNYDSKNMMHTIRLLQSCEQIFRTGFLQVRVDNRSELLDIKSGNHAYGAVMQKAEDLIQTIEHYYTTSTLPDYPDIQRTEGLLVEIRKKLYN
ncbi:nucleotidyltransferase domain-containing protein [Elizabethkingia anophelis]|uniref:Nucleotidyltransferase n=1 Tax=Elizabethkingia anophelis TaxID=1117645 RepID=A0AAU8UUT0_9FLAO|nr:nucleotidyltransferase domain-containing protein [Elizabethkingia anophelis]AQX02083.1 nucleotidyltransferase [Elizabethkingia anophelis]MCL1035188.1 nucleotidyltransferase domain-containing protein [Elizabethkingia anophelis]MCT3760231.1 nucleotidyltransferase domain-containing protein [Elizabethkingia anophelis]MCT3974891.1 nucleotidyltransferase domain-containing protein [Elizabethkingia anophelis]MCT4003272.1 nucleotidyltransferase domain-containing protein [Elizabethkingia anophelis]